LRAPVIIWVVRHGKNLYVGRYVPGCGLVRGAQERDQGHISAGGVEKEVAFVEVGAEVHDQLDAAYRTKHRRYAASIIDSISSPAARAATLKLMPR
jgi:hypothetical protein